MLLTNVVTPVTFKLTTVVCTPVIVRSEVTVAPQQIVTPTLNVDIP